MPNCTMTQKGNFKQRGRPFTHFFWQTWQLAAAHSYFYSFVTLMHVQHNHTLRRPRLKVLLKARIVLLKCRFCLLNGKCSNNNNSSLYDEANAHIQVYSRVDIVEEVDETLDQIKDKSRFIRNVITII